MLKKNGVFKTLFKEFILFNITSKLLLLAKHSIWINCLWKKVFKTVMGENNFRFKAYTWRKIDVQIALKSDGSRYWRQTIRRLWTYDGILYWIIHPLVYLGQYCLLWLSRTSGLSIREPLAGDIREWTPEFLHAEHVLCLELWPFSWIQEEEGMIWVDEAV